MISQRAGRWIRGAVMLAAWGWGPPGFGASIWSEADAPRVASAADVNPIELGMKFRSDRNGAITAIRFYKGPANTGAHVGRLWTAQGALLGGAAFTDETPTGWQEQPLTPPVGIVSNTTYVVSYFAPNGGYSLDAQGLNAAVSRPPLLALAGGEDGPNGVYRYSGSGFPTSGWAGHAPNYWVDVVFSESAGNPGPRALPDPSQGPGGPILVVADPANPFTRYYAEVLRTEGFNAFEVLDRDALSPEVLQGYDVAIVGETPLTAEQAGWLSDWVTDGGNLIAMRPDPVLRPLLGLLPAEGTLAEGYVRFDTSLPTARGLVGETLQMHGVADLLPPDPAAPVVEVAALYSDAVTPSGYPAVTLRAVGDQGGQAAAFMYDLARSVVLTRQGNPAWANQERDGFGPLRSSDLFYPDWIDLDKVAIPQADEQQRLLAHLILEMNRDRMPLPRFWYFPRGHRAVVVMTGDEHGCCPGTVARFNTYLAQSPPGCVAEDWECVRASSYVYPGGGLDDATAAAFHQQGFEIGVHVNTGCANYTPASMDGFMASQLAVIDAQLPSLPRQASHRTHCLVWTGWATSALVERDRGIRLDVNYYYWPPAWVGNRPGLFTGSGMPMRFADVDGRLIDVYQAATQMTDESGQSYPFTIDRLLDRAVGPDEYFGVFVANMHTDRAAHPDSDAIVASAQARGVPVVSGRQLLNWLDGRNASAFSDLSWNGTALTFSIDQDPDARNLQAIIPLQSIAGPLIDVARDGSPVAYQVDLIKGFAYAVFPALDGAYAATYAGADVSPPTLVGIPADQTMACDESPALPVVTAFDDRDPEPVVSFQEEVEGAACPRVITRTWSAVDASGNATQAVQRITLRPALTSYEDGAVIDEPTTWSSDRDRDGVVDAVIVLRGRVLVADATLTIEPGTVVYGDNRQGPLPGARPGSLIITRTGRIDARGRPDQPIVFTTGQAVDRDGNGLFDPAADDVSGDDHYVGPTPAHGSAPWTQRNPALPFDGSWGGLALLGQAYVANGATGPTTPSPLGGGILPGGEDLGAGAVYGGGDDLHDSGSLAYVSVRYGGQADDAGRRMGAVTLAAVGRGADVRQVEAYQCAGDGFHWRGGTVDTRFLTAWSVGGDSFAWDEGYRGRGQFWLSAQGAATHRVPPVAGDKALEGRGAAGRDTAQPSSIPTIYHWTAIGAKAGNPSRRNVAVHFLNGSGGRIYNAAFAGFDGGAALIEGAPGNGVYDAADNVGSRYRQGPGPFPLAGNDAIGAPDEPWTLVGPYPDQGFLGYDHQASETVRQRGLFGAGQPSPVTGFAGAEEARLEVGHSLFEDFGLGPIAVGLAAAGQGTGYGLEPADDGPHFGSAPDPTGFTLVQPDQSGAPNGNFQTGPGAPSPLPSWHQGLTRTTNALGMEVVDRFHPGLNRAAYRTLLGFDALAVSGRTPPADGFFAPVSFYGAFGAGNWASWTLTSRKGYLEGLPPMDEHGVDELLTGIRSTLRQADGEWRVTLDVPPMYAGVPAELFVGGYVEPDGPVFYWLGSGPDATADWTTSSEAPTPPSLSPLILNNAVFTVLDTATSRYPGNYPLVWCAVDLLVNGAYDPDAGYLTLGADGGVLTVP